MNQLQSSLRTQSQASSSGSPRTKQTKGEECTLKQLNLKEFRLCRIGYPFYFEHMQETFKGSSGEDRLGF